jgi:hypothetical protein
VSKARVRAWAFVVSACVFPLSACFALGCRSDGGAKPDPRAVPSASAPSEEDPNLKKKVTEADCGRFAENGVGVVIAGFKDAMKACAPSERDALAAQLDSHRSEMRANALALCVKHVGEEYLAKDGACYLKAKAIDALVGCRFAPMKDPNDGDLLEAGRTLGKTCGRTPGP